MGTQVTLEHVKWLELKTLEALGNPHTGWKRGTPVELDMYSKTLRKQETSIALNTTVYNKGCVPKR